MKKHLIVSLIIGVFLSFVVAKSLLKIGELREQRKTGTILRNIGISLMIYSNDYNDHYPIPSKWCDLLIENADVSPQAFRSSAAPVGPSNFAINPQCDPNSPETVVLCFETTPGWNQNGGAELLNTQEQNGCNVLFNDGSVGYIPVAKWDSLQWK